MLSEDEQREKLHKRVSNDYAAHPLKTEETRQLVDSLAEGFVYLAHRLVRDLPLGREMALALTDLESAKRNAVAAIALNQD